uniref:Uncharacterized protein n=1 Tax=Aureoumbra lagunensis TaxID=44058 RepID=A0A7S3JNP4_9STRA
MEKNDPKLWGISREPDIKRRRMNKNFLIRTINSVNVHNRRLRETSIQSIPTPSQFQSSIDDQTEKVATCAFRQEQAVCTNEKRKIENIEEDISNLEQDDNGDDSKLSSSSSLKKRYKMKEMSRRRKVER